MNNNTFNHEIEIAVLGAMLLESKSIVEVIGILNENDFHLETHKDIYNAIKQMYSDNEKIDLLTVTNKLRTDQVKNVNAYYITQLTNRVNSAANIVTHAYILKQFCIKRQLLKITDKINSGIQGDALQLLQDTETDIFNISKLNSKSNVFKLHDQYNEILEDIQENMNKKYNGELTGIPTGLKSLDEITGGWQKSDLIIFAARTSVGKTAFALQSTLHAAMAGYKVAFFSLEMTKEKLIKRMMSNITDIDHTKIQRNQLHEDEFEQLKEAKSTFSECKVFFDDQASLSTFQLNTRIKQMDYEENGIDLMIVDYLQLMNHKDAGRNREQEISMISQTLKRIAKDLNIPVVALSQLSRKVEDRANKQPVLSDLRESGSIEQDADQVIFLYRPELCGVQNDANGNSTKNVCFIDVAKNRNGRLETINAYSYLDKMKFTDSKIVNAGDEVYQPF